MWERKKEIERERDGERKRERREIKGERVYVHIGIYI